MGSLLKLFFKVPMWTIWVFVFVFQFIKHIYRAEKKGKKKNQAEQEELAERALQLLLYKMKHKKADAWHHKMHMYRLKKRGRTRVSMAHEPQPFPSGFSDAPMPETKTGYEDYPLLHELLK